MSSNEGNCESKICEILEIESGHIPIKAAKSEKNYKFKIAKQHLINILLLIFCIIRIIVIKKIKYS